MPEHERRTVTEDRPGLGFMLAALAVLVVASATAWFTWSHPGAGEGRLQSIRESMKFDWKSAKGAPQLLVSYDGSFPTKKLKLMIDTGSGEADIMVGPFRPGDRREFILDPRYTRGLDSTAWKVRVAEEIEG